MSRSERGFTLIELIVVIAVITVLAAVVSPLVFRNVGDAKLAAAQTQVQTFGLALDAYRLDNDYYPSTSQGLDALVRQPQGQPEARGWRGPYLKREIPRDPWDRPYAYRSPGDSVPQGYDLTSFGRDGRAGGTGEDADIVSWRAGPPR